MQKNRSKNKTKWLLLAIMMVFTLLLTSCFPGRVEDISSKPAGFFMGIWHGWLAPLSLIVSLFKPETRIYEVVNTGWWYDFGYYIAIISGFGGLSLFREKKRDHKES